MTASAPAVSPVYDAPGTVVLRDARLVSAWVDCVGGECDRSLLTIALRRVVEPGLGESSSDVSVVTETRWVAAARAGAETIVVSPRLLAELPKARCWRHDHPLWVLSQLLHASAIEHDGRWLDPSEYTERFPDVRIGPGCRIGDGARLAAGVELEPNVVVYARVVLGPHVRVGAGSIIGRPGFGWTLAPDGRRTRVPQLGGVSIDSDAELGPLCSVDAGTLRATSIGQRTKLDAQVHVGHNARIGQDCLIADDPISSPV